VCFYIQNGFGAYPTYYPLISKTNVDLKGKVGLQTKIGLKGEVGHKYEVGL
jgi:hypothetical protein